MYRHANMDIFLDPAVHGRGVGTDAVRTLTRHLVRDRGHHRLVIDPAADNVAAIRCYAKVGFRPVGVMRQYEQGPDGTLARRAPDGPRGRRPDPLTVAVDPASAARRVSGRGGGGGRPRAARRRGGWARRAGRRGGSPCPWASPAGRQHDRRRLGQHDLQGQPGRRARSGRARPSARAVDGPDAADLAARHHQRLGQHDGVVDDEPGRHGHQPTPAELVPAAREQPAGADGEERRDDGRAPTPAPPTAAARRRRRRPTPPTTRPSPRGSRTGGRSGKRCSSPYADAWTYTPPGLGPADEDGGDDGGDGQRQRRAAVGPGGERHAGDHDRRRHDRPHGRQRQQPGHGEGERAGAPTPPTSRRWRPPARRRCAPRRRRRRRGRRTRPRPARPAGRPTP